MTDEVELHFERTPLPTLWVSALFVLADGSTLELRVPGCVQAVATSLPDGLGERAVLRYTDAQGRTRTGRLTQMGL